MVAAGEAKWNVKSGLVMLLPHGYDGQGAEHSSCRIERYLSLVGEDFAFPKVDDTDAESIKKINIQVVNTTTAANYFHLLRRQLRRPFRKPLIVAAPKKLLKFSKANSDLEDFKEGLRFTRVVKDQNQNLVS